MKVLALDFDGVISDSAMESFVVALRTWASLRPESRLAGLADTLSFAPALELDAHPLFTDFLALMPLSNRAEDFAVVLSLIEQSVEVDDQADYDAFRDRLAPDFLDAYHARFYVERSALHALDPRAWTRLVRPYDEIVRIVRRRADAAAIRIATAKDLHSVELLLERFGLADLFPRDTVVDKEHGTTKRAHLTTLQQRLGVDFGEMTFVDDKVNHLQDVAPLGVRCALAAWGYNGERERRLARADGHLVCGLADFERQVFGAPAPPDGAHPDETHRNDPRRDE